MKILVACEYSGIVRDAFIAKGHDAISCDLIPTESPGPHYQGDVYDILYEWYVTHLVNISVLAVCLGIYEDLKEFP